MAAIDGGTMVGWFGGAGSVGIAPVPDEGARFRAGAVWTSGTAAGGTGGGRSWNIWAETGAGSSAASAKPAVVASAIAGKGHPPRPNPTIPLPPEIMAMLFTENAANSSLCHAGSARGVAEPALAPNVNAAVVQSGSPPRLAGLNHAGGLQ